MLHAMAILFAFLFFVFCFSFLTCLLNDNDRPLFNLMSEETIFLYCKFAVLVYMYYEFKESFIQFTAFSAIIKNTDHMIAVHLDNYNLHALAVKTQLCGLIHVKQLVPLWSSQ